MFRIALSELGRRLQNRYSPQTLVETLSEWQWEQFARARSWLNPSYYSDIFHDNASGCLTCGGTVTPTMPERDMAS